MAARLLATGKPGRIALMVKLADLDDHLAQGWDPPGAPPYAWARRCVEEHVSVQLPAALAS